MKIALCIKGNFSLEKGCTKNRVELAESLSKRGWEPSMVGKEILGIPAVQKYDPAIYSKALKEFLLKNYDEFDVVLLEYDTLPFERNLFNKNTLFVARPAILAFHQDFIKFPSDFKTNVFSFIKNTMNKYGGGKKDWKTYLKRVEYCLHQADLIQVQNKKDYELLIKLGFPPYKIIIIPNGITAERISDFKECTKDYEKNYKLAFVGTFDFRKGAMDFPFILKELKKKFPGLKLKLLGTKGLFQTKEQVLKFFPKKYHKDIEVIPGFKAEDLPQLLTDCHLGVFPSYLESFGFGALEMMCAGLPVVAYDSPGPCDFVPQDLQVPTGDRKALASKLLSLLENKTLLEEKALEAREKVVNQYCWDDITVLLEKQYRDHLKRIRTLSSVSAIT